MLIHPIQVSERYPIGSVVEAFAPPNDDWMLCDGQILAQADYSKLYSLMDRPHPIFQHWELIHSGMTTQTEIYALVNTGTIIVGLGYGGRVAYSTNGYSWIDSQLPTFTYYFQGLAYDGTTFVGMPTNSSPQVDFITSTDGQNWTERSTLSPSLEAKDICYDGTYFYIIDYNGITTFRSSDGISWTQMTDVPDTSFWGIAASPDAVVSISLGGDLVVSYDQATTWKKYTVPNQSCYNIVYDSTDDIFVATWYYDWLFGISPGDDGVNWEFFNIYTGMYGQKRDLYLNSYSGGNGIIRVGSYWFFIDKYNYHMIILLI